MLKMPKKPFLNKDDNSSKKKIEIKGKNRIKTLKRIWQYLAANKTQLFLVLFMVFLSSILGLLGPYLLGVTVDKFIVSGLSEGLPLLMFILVFVYILHAMTVWFQNYWMIGIAQDTVFTMRSRLFIHIQELPISYFDKRQHGQIMSRVTNDIENVSNTLNSSFIQICSSVLTLVGTVIVMLILSPILTLITLTVVPLMFLGLKWITNRTGELFKAQSRNIGELNGFIEETISGQKVVKTYSQEKKMIEEFMVKNENLKASGYWAQTYSGFIPKLMNVLNNLSFAVIAGAGGILALKGMVTIGVIVTFAEYSRQFTRPLNDLANQFNTLLSAIAGAERVFEVMDEEVEEKEDNKLLEFPIKKGEVEFSNVSFSYEKDGNTVSNISFKANAGDMVALVGPTGAGKSTIINLLSRFYDPENGIITIDGQNIRYNKRKSLRQNMGFVLQDPFLFQGTIMENIRYGRLDATNDEVIEAAKLANAHSFIKKLPNQYETMLVGDGSGISQGQKQLLSIARAILADPTILILDEATSSIDTITEMKIQEALYRLMNGRTSFVIAHRLNTIQHADQILVLDKGKIIEKGTHHTLVNDGGFYYELVNSQMKNEIL